MKTKKRGSQEAQATKRTLVVDFLIKNTRYGSQKKAAEIFKLSISAVQKIWKNYQLHGKKGLSPKKRGVKEGKKISNVQINAVKRAITDKTPDQLKLPFGLWTREAVGRFLAVNFDIKLSRHQVGRYLKSWGFTPQKPIYKAFEQKPEEVKKWLVETYPAIKERAKIESSDIYFQDESGMRSDHQAGKTFAPKGKTPVIKKTGKRFSLNMISAINNRGYLHFMILKEKFNSVVFITFLKKMIRYNKRKIFLITDGHSAHKSMMVKEWVEKHKDKIELFYLPTYSPELNPQEYLNQDVKTNAVGRRRAINKEQLSSNVIQFLQKKKRNKNKIKAYFKEKHVRYAI